MRIGMAGGVGSTVIIAELGNNHEGDPAVATQLIDVAADCGVDAVKLQTATPELFARPSQPERLAQMRRFALTADELGRLAEHARSRGLAFLSTPLDLASVELLDPLVDAFKVASGDNDFMPLLDVLTADPRPLIVSTGLLGLAEIVQMERRLASARRDGAASLAFLHCVTAYPAPPEQANLRAIATLRDRLDSTVGYSDHTVGIEAAVLSVALGARIVEKHVTLSHFYSDFRDHRLSAEPDELGEMVRRIRQAATMLGSGAKTLADAERPLVDTVRRSIVAARPLGEGHVIEAGDLAWMRPRDGLPPGREAELIGRSLRRPVLAGEPLRTADLRPQEHRR